MHEGANTFAESDSRLESPTKGVPQTDSTKMHGPKAPSVNSARPQQKNEAQQESATSLRIQEAIAAIARGWPIIRLFEKRPIDKGWTDSGIVSAKTARHWATKHNIGIRTGSVSDLIVIDEDPRNGGDAKKLNLPNTVIVATGNGGHHFYFRIPKNMTVQNSNGLLAPGIDIKCENGQVVFVGAVHPDTGNTYRWLEGHSPHEVEIAEFPEHLLPCLTVKKPNVGKRHAEKTGSKLIQKPKQYSATCLANAIDRISRSIPGTRNDTLNREAFNCGKLIAANLLDRGQAYSELESAAMESGLEPKEIESTLSRALEQGALSKSEFTIIESPAVDNPVTAKNTHPINNTDSGNAERLIRQYGHDLHYCYNWNKWLVYDGQRWLADARGAAMGFTKIVARNIRKEANQCPDDHSRDETRKWSKTSERADKRRSMLSLAMYEPNVAIGIQDLNRNPWLFNCKNGTLDLEKDKFQYARRSDLITKQAPVHYDKNATCPLWEQTLKRILPNDEVREFIQRAVGSSLTGLTGDQVLLFLYGLGANGKSVFLRTIMDLMGRDYSIQAAPDLLLEKKAAHPTELADLFGIRFLSVTELGPERVFNETLIKQMTGEDKIRARRMREDFWEFDATHHIWIAANHKPTIRGTDYAIWRRVLIIPFGETIPANERDPHLAKKLRAEMPGILNWAIEGCNQWRLTGLRPPEIVQLATDEYRTDMDVTGRFLAERTVSDKDLRTNSTTLYFAYCDWARSSGEEELTQKKFGQSLTEKGTIRQKSGGLYHYTGIGLKPDNDNSVSKKGRSGPSFGLDKKNEPLKNACAETRSQSSPSSLFQIDLDSNPHWQGFDDGD